MTVVCEGVVEAGCGAVQVAGTLAGGGHVATASIQVLKLCRVKDA